MPVSPLTIAGFTAAASAGAGALSLVLKPALKNLIIPEPKESSLSDQLQFESVLKDGVTIRGKDGSLTQTIQLGGIDLSSKTAEELKALMTKRQSWLDLMANEGVSFKIITTREEHAHNLQAGYEYPLLEKIHTTWMKQFTTTYVNKHYLVITKLPKRLNNWKNFIPESLIKNNRKNCATTASKAISSQKATLNTLEEIVTQTLEVLFDFQPIVLNNGEEGKHSPLLTFWSSLLNREHTPIAFHEDHISERLTSKSVSFDPQTGVITYHNGIHPEGITHTYEAVISLKTWGEQSTSHILKDLLSLKGKLTVLHLLEGATKITGAGILKHQHLQAKMNILNQKGPLEFEEAIYHVGNGDATYYSYQLSIFAHANSEEDLNTLISEIKRILRDYGIAPAVDTGAAEWLWRSQFPGFEKPIRITHPLSPNLAQMITFERDQTGLESCDWGQGALRLFKTLSGSGYSQQLHQSEAKEEIAHSLTVAPSNSGKTTLFQHLIGGALRHPNLRAYIFDRFNGTQIFTESVGGAYIDLKQGSTPLNPLVCEDTLQNRKFLKDFFIMLAGIERTKEDNALDECASRAVSEIFSLLPHQRTLNAVIDEAFDHGSPLKQGLKKWTGNDPLAQWFNGTKPLTKEQLEKCRYEDSGNTDGLSQDGFPSHATDEEETYQAFDALSMDSSRLVAFEMTQILQDPITAPVMTYYILHRIRSLIQHQALPHFIFIDEAAAMLKNPLFCKEVEAMLFEHRKLRGSVNLCFQSPQSIQATGIGSMILEQCPTFFLFQNPAANKDEYEMFELTQSQWDYIKGNNRAARHLKRSVLLKKHKGESVILDIDLSPLGPLLKLYKSGSEPVQLMKQLQQKWGIDKWVEEYLA